VDDDRKCRDGRDIERQSREPLVGLTHRLLFFSVACRERGANSGSRETSIIGTEHRVGSSDASG
jgi:hypothetical protein